MTHHTRAQGAGLANGHELYHSDRQSPATGCPIPQSAVMRRPLM